jgi:hypothetical protein
VAAVDQFKSSEFPDADQGASSAVVNIVTKSGSNQLHGEVFEFLRNRVLDARSFFAPAREDLKRNQFGGALGGPLKKDRIWFHAFYEQLRELAAFSMSRYTPTAEMFGGDFAATGPHRYDPATYRQESGSDSRFRSRDSGGRVNPVAGTFWRTTVSARASSRPGKFSQTRAGRSTTGKAAVGWTWRWAVAPSCSVSFFGRARRPCSQACSR